MLTCTIDRETNQLVEVLPDGSRGRSMLCRGINVVFKQAPYHPDLDGFNVHTSFCETDVNILARLGMNVIRLHVSWAALEPVRGEYNTEYLHTIRRIVRMCAARSIYTLLEFHQDVLCRQLCGHGAPDWFYRSGWTPSWMRFPWPIRWRPFDITGKSSLPDPEQAKSWKWYLGYLTYAGCQAWQKFYNNDDGLLDAFGRYWQTVAAFFKDEPYILGYELINEPWLGNIYKNPLLLLPGRAGRVNIHRLNGTVGKAIRAVDLHTPIFVADPTLDTASGFAQIPFAHHLPTKTGETVHQTMAGPSVLAYHYYQPPARMPVDRFMKAKLASARRLGAGTLLTEFEMWPGTLAKRSEKLARVRDVLEAADALRQSWIGWSYKIFSQDRSDEAWDGSLFDPTTGNIIPEMEKLMSRPFAPRVAGNIQQMSFDPTAAMFELRYAPARECDMSTDIFTQEQIWYPSGFIVRARLEGSDTEERDVPFIVSDPVPTGERYLSIQGSDEIPLIHHVVCVTVVPEAHIDTVNVRAME